MIENSRIQKKEKKQEKIMSFARIYTDISAKLGDECNDLYNKDLIKKIHSFTTDYKWNFDEENEGQEKGIHLFQFLLLSLFSY